MAHASGRLRRHWGLKSTRGNSAASRQANPIERLEDRLVLAPLTWSTGPALPTGRDHAIAVSDGYAGVYLFSGATTVYHQGASALSAWTTSPSLQNIGAGMGAARTSAQIVAFGGLTGGEATPDSILYDPAIGDNQDTAPMHVGRYLPGSGSYNGRAYAFGGRNGNSVYGSAEYYSASTDSWTTVASMPSAMYGFATVDDHEGHFYTFGGATTSSANSVTGVVYEYDAASNTWTSLAPLPTAVREAGAAMALDINGDPFVYIVGGATLPSGSTTAVLTNVVQVYDVTNNTWSTATPLPVAIKGAAARVDADDRIEIVGGIIGTTAQGAVYVSQKLNQPDIQPAFTSTPITKGSADKPYSYQATATGNPLPTFSLPTAPAGMTINTSSGLITWQPQASQVGTESVVVRATNSAGSVDQSFSVSVVLETVAPTPPTNVHVSGVTTSSLSIAWDPGTDNTAVASYNVYYTYRYGWRSSHTGYALIGNTTGTSFTHTGLGSFVSKSYVVRSVDTSGNVSGNSLKATGTTYAVPTLSPYSGGAPSVAALHTLSFSLYSRANPAATFSLVNGPAGMTVDPATGLVKWTPSVSNAGLVPATFRATNIVGSADLNVSINVTPDLPVLSYRINPGGGPSYAVAGSPISIQLSDYSLTPSTYSIVTGPATMTIDPITGMATWTPAAAEAGATAVTFHAVNTAGSANLNVNFTTYFTPAPTNIAATNVTTTSATIAWTPPADTSNIASYVIRASYRTRAGRAYTTKSFTFTAPAGATSVNATGLNAYKTYTPYVYAVDAAGHVGETGRGLAFTTNTPPATPPPVSPQSLPIAAAIGGASSASGPKSAPEFAPGLSFNVSFDDPSGTWLADYDDITRMLQAAGAEWGRAFDADAAIEVVVGFDDTLATTSARSLAVAYLETDADGYDVYEQGAAAEINTGVDPNGAAADVELNIGVMPGANFLTDGLWFDPDTASRTAAIPVGKFDAMSVMMQALGHAIGFNGWADPVTGELPGTYMSSFDQYIVGTDTGLAFNGGWANESAGGVDPALTVGDVYHFAGSTGPDLLDSAGLQPQARYDLSAMDVAVMKDIGMSMDVAAPNVALKQFEFETAQRIVVQFDESVRASLDAGDFTLLRLTSGGALTVDPSSIQLSYDRATNTAALSFPGMCASGLSDGDYVLSISAAGITDLAGNQMSNDQLLSFFVLAGDANHDRKVDVNDLGILATNWQQSPRTFSQGDFDYSGTVDVNDLGILASNWQQQLAAPSAPFATASRKPSTIKRVAMEVL